MVPDACGFFSRAPLCFGVNYRLLPIPDVKTRKAARTKKNGGCALRPARHGKHDLHCAVVYRHFGVCYFDPSSDGARQFCSPVSALATEQRVGV